MSGRRVAAIVFAAVPVEPTARLIRQLASLSSPFVVAADRGATNAFRFGYQPDVVVGDLDSIDQSTLAEVNRRGVPIETYPRDKNATDGQLAIERALVSDPTHLLLLGFLGGPRLDQALASVLLLQRLTVPAVLLDERNECQLVRPGSEHVWRTAQGEVVSLLPVCGAFSGADGASGAVEGVRTAGLRWPLNGERLLLGDTRGVSNEPAADQASLSIESGLLLLTRHFADA